MTSKLESIGLLMEAESSFFTDSTGEAVDIAMNPESVDSVEDAAIENVSNRKKKDSEESVSFNILSRVLQVMKKASSEADLLQKVKDLQKDHFPKGSEDFKILKSILTSFNNILSKDLNESDKEIKSLSSSFDVPESAIKKVISDFKNKIENKETHNEFVGDSTRVKDALLRIAEIPGKSLKGNPPVLTSNRVDEIRNLINKSPVSDELISKVRKWFNAVYRISPENASDLSKFNFDSLYKSNMKPFKKPEVSDSDFFKQLDNFIKGTDILHDLNDPDVPINDKKEIKKNLYTDFNEFISGENGEGLIDFDAEYEPDSDEEKQRRYFISKVNSFLNDPTFSGRTEKELPNLDDETNEINKFYNWINGTTYLDDLNRPDLPSSVKESILKNIYLDFSKNSDNPEIRTLYSNTNNLDPREQYKKDNLRKVFEYRINSMLRLDDVPSVYSKINLPDTIHSHKAREILKNKLDNYFKDDKKTNPGSSNRAEDSKSKTFFNDVSTQDTLSNYALDKVPEEGLTHKHTDFKGLGVNDLKSVVSFIKSHDFDNLHDWNQLKSLASNITSKPLKDRLLREVSLVLDSLEDISKKDLNEFISTENYFKKYLTAEQQELFKNDPSSREDLINLIRVAREENGDFDSDRARKFRQIQSEIRNAEEKNKGFFGYGRGNLREFVDSLGDNYSLDTIDYEEPPDEGVSNEDRQEIFGKGSDSDYEIKPTSPEELKPHEPEIDRFKTVPELKKVHTQDELSADSELSFNNSFASNQEQFRSRVSNEVSESVKSIEEVIDASYPNSSLDVKKLIIEEDSLINDSFNCFQLNGLPYSETRGSSVSVMTYLDKFISLCPPEVATKVKGLVDYGHLTMDTYYVLYNVKTKSDSGFSTILQQASVVNDESYYKNVEAYIKHRVSSNYKDKQLFCDCYIKKSTILLTLNDSAQDILGVDTLVLGQFLTIPSSSLISKSGKGIEKTLDTFKPGDSSGLEDGENIFTQDELDNYYNNASDYGLDDEDDY